VKNANSTCLNGQPLREDLERRLGREVASRERRQLLRAFGAADGRARDARVVFGVILGTGVGGGIVVVAASLTGANAIAGEWGHNRCRLPGTGDHPLPLCYCGGAGASRPISRARASARTMRARRRAARCRGDRRACREGDAACDRHARTLRGAPRALRSPA
jgi:fructokinase